MRGKLGQKIAEFDNLADLTLYLREELRPNGFSEKETRKIIFDSFSINLSDEILREIECYEDNESLNQLIESILPKPKLRPKLEKQKEKQRVTFR